MITTDRTITTDDGARLAVTLHRPETPVPDSPLVVLVHGWAASRTVWHAVARQLAAAGHTVAAYDQRGHAASTAGEQPLSIARLGQDLATVVDTLSPDRPVVVAGHSGGGYAALAYAAHLHAATPDAAPRRLAALLLASTASHDQVTPAGEIRMMGSQLFTRALRVPWLGRQLLGKTLAPTATLATREQNRQLFANTPPAVRAAYFGATHDMDLRPQLAAITAPTTVLTGTQDKIVNPNHSHHLARALPDTQLDTIPGSGHNLPLESPERLTHHISALIARVGGYPRS
ncbi:alpha/beta fold hydrolase [Kitasatospora sp. NPDC059747]|uniref:alpha/beta fold hydrolase n=1 Tax=Kitasatospora sp. NPDC059747 TaxID=3346930 RepID=UPI0036492CCE